MSWKKWVIGIIAIITIVLLVYFYVPVIKCENIELMLNGTSKTNSFFITVREYVKNKGCLF